MFNVHFYKVKGEECYHLGTVAFSCSVLNKEKLDSTWKEEYPEATTYSIEYH